MLLLASVIVALPMAQAASAATCDSSGPGGYTVSLCIDDPADGASVTGDTSVTASFTVTGGTSPGASKLEFFLDSQHLLTDYEAPYTFVLPTDTFVDGQAVVGVEANMRDGFVTSRTTITITLSNGVTTPPDPPTGFTPTSGTTPAPGAPFVVAATGDGASGQSTSDDVVDIVASFDPNMFVYLGDVYETGTYTEFRNWYGDGDRFGSFASITNPVLGNHEQMDGQWPGYDRYWASPDPYYSYDANGWHFIVMNLQDDGPSSTQTAWLAADLAANTAECTIAAFHYPVLNVGRHDDTPALFPTWAQLVDAGVDVVLTAHDHNYQRWVPMDSNLVEDPDGATQFVLGAGGHGIQNFTRSDARLAVGADTVPTAFGALKLELNQHGAAFRYENTSATVLDSGTLQCSGTGTDGTPPSVPADVVANAVSGNQVDLSWSPSSDNVGVDHYTVLRDGAPIATVPGTTPSYTDNTVSPFTTYEYRIEAHDAAGNTSGPSAPSMVTTPAPPAQLTFVPVADSEVDASAPDTSLGSTTTMRVDAEPDRRGYARFDVSGLSGAVTSATLRVHADSTHASGYEVQQVTDNGWNESTITYNNAPAFGPVLGSSGATTSGTYNDIDVTAHVTGNGTYSFALTPLNNTNLPLATRESTNPPELVVVQDTSGNTPPTADDVTLTTDENTAGSWTPSVSDPDPDTLTCSIAAQPTNGSASVASDCSSGQYTPDADYAGPDSFTYEVSDGSFTDTGEVSVTVNAVNDAPTADDQSVTVEQDTATTVTLTGSDVDGDCPLTFAVDTPPANGSVGAVTNEQCSSGVASADVVYTPDAGYTGADSFTVTVTDPSGGVSAPATISVTVDPPQTNFTFPSVADSYVAANAVGTNYGSRTSMRVDGSPVLRSYARFDVSGLSGAVTSATLRVHADSTHASGYEVQQVTDNGWNESTITYNNAPAFGPVLGSSGATTSGTYNDIDVTAHVTGNGTYSFALTPLNNTNLPLATRESTNPPELVVVQDTSGNTPPTADDVTLTTDENTAGSWTPSVSDPDPDTLTCSIAAQPTNGSASVASDCSSGQYTPDADYAGPDSFTYEVSDGSFTDTGEVSVTVNAVNDAPTADDQSVTVEQDTATTVTLTGSDVDGDCPLTFAVDTPPANGSVGAVTNEQCSSGVASADVVYTPDAGYTGADSFTVTVTDPSGGVSAPATISVTVDPPQTNFTFPSVADSYVAANAVGTNYGSRTSMRVDGSPVLRSYARFDVSGLSGAVTSATLRVHADSTHASGYEVQQVTDNGWNESTITYNNAPAFGPVLGSSGATTSGTYNDIDVTAHVTGNGTYSFALTPLNNTNLRLATRESTNPPELVVVVAP